MKVICSGRKTSRTTMLIDLCHEAEYERREVSYIVCHSPQEARRIFEKAIEMNKRVSFPISYDEFMRGEYHAPHIQNFFFDNADMFLQSLTPVNVAAITVLKTEESELV